MNWNACIQITLLLAVVATGCPDCRAEEPSGPESLVADLNGDGKAETISWRRLGSDNEIGTFFQVVVKESSSATLWKSPEILDASHPLAFGEWHFGISLPQLAADVNNDGMVELLVPAPQSDVSPTFFRVLQWTGSAFEPKQSRALTGKGQKGAAFQWSEDPSASDYWVHRWLGSSGDGGWIVELSTLPDSGEMRVATAVIFAKGQGFELRRWIQLPAKPADTADAVAPENMAVSYRARLSAADHVNSTGAALKKIIDVLRQDRANYHRGTHRDAEDKGDEKFSSAAAREAMVSLQVSVHGGAKAENEIIHGTPVVEVTISDGGLQVAIVND